ncbi:TetR family transcriptional regulator [Streptomyces sp. NPDC050804]|uniref:TetR/AcrR family transcriptional regulator n=1 Tax=Streptomyces sp. NPDC050804 TaxID=3154745 RepID=UPI0034412CCD
MTQRQDIGRSTRDAADTRRRILEAATEEFAAVGLSGGRIARIADKAQANQRMIYAYYSNKDGLFNAVLEHHVLLAQDAVTLDAANLPDYARQVFDFYRANPHFVRLLLWQHLERPDLTNSLVPVQRAVADKIKAIEGAQAAGRVSSRLSAQQLLDHISALTLGNIAGHPNDWTEEERESVTHSVTLLATPSAAPETTTPAP